MTDTADFPAITFLDSLGTEAQSAGDLKFRAAHKQTRIKTQVVHDAISDAVFHDCRTISGFQFQDRPVTGPEDQILEIKSDAALLPLTKLVLKKPPATPQAPRRSRHAKPNTVVRVHAFTPVNELAGTVREINLESERFFAVLSAPGGSEEAVAEFRLRALDDNQREMLRPGLPFFFVAGYEDVYEGSRLVKREPTTKFILRTMPPPTEAALRVGEATADRLLPSE